MKLCFTRRASMTSSPLWTVLAVAGAALAGCQASPDAVSSAETRVFLPMQSSDSQEWGYVDLHGKWRIEPRLDQVTRFSEGLAVVYDGRDWLFIDGNGNSAFPMRFESRGSSSINGVEFQSPGAKSFSEGLAAVYLKSGRSAFIDLNGDVKIEDEFSPAGPFNDGIARIYGWEGYGYIDSSGTVLIPPKLRRAGNFSEGLAPAQDAAIELWGFIDTSGAWVIEPQYYNAGSFSDGLAPVSHEWAGWSGYIDQTGELAISGEFRRLDPFSSGIARVHYATHSSYITTSGEPAFAQEIDDSFCYWGSFIDGLALVALPTGEGECNWAGSGEGLRTFVAALENAQWAYIDRGGNIVARQAQ